MIPYQYDSSRSTSREIKTVTLVGRDKINLHRAVSDDSKGTAILAQTLLDIFKSYLCEVQIVHINHISLFYR